MEDETAVALVPSTQVIVSAPYRHSFHSIPNDYALVLNNTPQITELASPSDSISRSSRKNAPKFTWEALSAIISVLYCKLLVVLGLALPVTGLLTRVIPRYFYEGFYVFLYGGSVAFMLSLHVISIQRKTRRMLSKHKKTTSEEDYSEVIQHGSFYLRLGACAFGIGSMVYSGLEFGGHFLKYGAPCDSNVLSVIKPALRIIFTLLQIHFIFLSHNNLHKTKFSSLVRISLGHMLATNLAEWLGVVIEETSHEIHHLRPSVDIKDHHGGSNYTERSDCVASNSNILVRGATAYLFPCTIEYSLICAVTLIEMMKHIKIEKKVEKKHKLAKKASATSMREKNLQYSVDCSKTEKGLMLGLICNVYTCISLIVFFSIKDSQEESAYFCLTLCESILNALSLIAMAIACLQMRNLAYCVHRLDSTGSMNLGLDISLLLKAQIGSYVYCVFSAIACYFTPGTSMLPELFSILQTSVQTTFIIDTWWKRCATAKDQEKKPGRQCLTFLRSVNMSMWTISITEKNRAVLKPIQMKFFGMWPWTIITHTSMPLYVFYRFHSSICFFEIWRNSYKGIHVVPDSDVIF